MAEATAANRRDLERTAVTTAAALAVLAVLAPFTATPDTIAPAVRQALKTAMWLVEHRKLTVIGPPRVLYCSCGPVEVLGNAVVPIGPTQPVQTPLARIGRLAGRRAMRFTHRGPYAELARTHERITEYLVESGLFRNPADWQAHLPVWEEYDNDPQTTPEADLMTHIFVPIR